MKNTSNSIQDTVVIGNAVAAVCANVADERGAGDTVSLGGFEE
jgi:hypothetical protein